MYFKDFTSSTNVYLNIRLVNVLSKNSTPYITMVLFLVFEHSNLYQVIGYLA